MVGVTSAWYLAKAGHKVTLLERRDGVAPETSHANAGQKPLLLPAAPGIPPRPPNGCCKSSPLHGAAHLTSSAALDAEDVRQLHAGGPCGQQGVMYGWPNTAATA